MLMRQGKYVLSIGSKIEKSSLQSQDDPICGENLFFFLFFFRFSAEFGGEISRLRGKKTTELRRRLFLFFGPHLNKYGLKFPKSRGRSLVLEFMRTFIPRTLFKLLERTLTLIDLLFWNEMKDACNGISFLYSFEVRSKTSETLQACNLKSLQFQKLFQQRLWKKQLYRGPDMFPSRVKPKTIKIDIHNFSAWRSAFKEIVWSLYRVW